MTKGPETQSLCPRFTIDRGATFALVETSIGPVRAVLQEQHDDGTATVLHGGNEVRGRLLGFHHEDSQG